MMSEYTDHFLLWAMTMTQFLPYGKQSINENDTKAVQEALMGDIITRGKNVASFEEEICSYTGARFAVAFSSGSSALSAAYSAVEISDRDLVITSPNTFIATVAEAKRCGSTIQYTDIDKYGNMSLDDLRSQLSTLRSRGRFCIVPVHFAGVPCDMEAISEMICHPETVVIEDAAHALGSFYKDGTPVGSSRFSDMTVLSFHPVKNITTGEGGMVTTNSEKLYEKLRLYRNSGIDRERLLYQQAPSKGYYEVHSLSGNFHMNEMEAALGRSQLRRIDQFREKKEKLRALYREKLSKIPGIELPVEDLLGKVLYHLYVIRISFQELGIDRDSFMQRLEDAGIGSQFHYVPLYNHSALGPRPKFYKEKFPMMEEYCQRALSIPFYVDMSEEDVNRVVTALRKIILS